MGIVFPGQHDKAHYAWTNFINQIPERTSQFLDEFLSADDGADGDDGDNLEGDGEVDDTNEYPQEVIDLPPVVLAQAQAQSQAQARAATPPTRKPAIKKSKG